MGEISALEQLASSILFISLSYTNGFQVVSTSSFLHTIHLPTSHIYVKISASILHCFIFENVLFLSIGKMRTRDLAMNLLFLVLHLHRVCQTWCFVCEQTVRVLNY